MKKIIIIASAILTINSFSAQILGNGTTQYGLGTFADKEIKSIIFGQYNLDNELVAVAKGKGSDPISLEQANAEGKKDLEKAIGDYSYNVLKEYLDGTLVTGPGFDYQKMKDFSIDIAKESMKNAEKRGEWTTSKNQIVVLYKVNKSNIRSIASQYFKDRLSLVILKLNEYKDTLEKTNK